MKPAASFSPWGKGGRKFEGKFKGAAFLQLLKKLKMFTRLLRGREKKEQNLILGVNSNLVSTSSISSCADTILVALCSTFEIP